jgi:hypothetical protein
VSRGLGRIQRTALQVLLDGHWHTTPAIAVRIYGHKPHVTTTAMPTPSQMVATRRALSALARAGLVYCVSGQPTRWTASRDRHLADQLRRGHYLQSVPTRPVMYFEHDGAVVCFAVPANRNISTWLLGKPNSVLELSRLWAHDGHAPNLLTKALGAAISELRRKHPQCEALISYADPNVGHNGNVYRAASWVDLGPVKESRYYRDANGKPVSRRAFNGRIPCRKSAIEAAGYSEEQARPKRRFARGLTRSARKLIDIKVREANHDCQSPTLTKLNSGAAPPP